MRKNQSAATQPWFRMFGTMDLRDAQAIIYDTSGGMTLDPEAVATVFRYIPRDDKRRSFDEKEKLEFLGDRVGYLAAVDVLRTALPENMRGKLEEAAKPTTDNEVYAAHLIRRNLNEAIYANPGQDIQPPYGKAAADTYEALLAAMYLQDKNIALDFAKTDVKAMLGYGENPREAKDAYIKATVHTGQRENSSSNKGASSRAFDGSSLVGTFLENANIVAPALEMTTVQRKVLRVLGEAVIQLVLAERLYRSQIKSVGGYEEVMKTHMSTPVFVAHARRFALDKSLWGSENEIYPDNEKVLRDSYAASIGAFYVYAPDKAFEIANEHLSDVLSKSPSYKDAANIYTQEVIGKAARTVDFKQALTDITTLIVSKSHARPVSAKPIYVTIRDASAGNLSIVAVVIPSGIVDRASPNNAHSNELGYFAATGEGSNQAAAAQEAARRLVRWLLERALATRVDDKVRLNTNQYGERVRHIFARNTQFSANYRPIAAMINNKPHIIFAYGDFTAWPF